MNALSLRSLSDNRKSAIGNLKLVGISLIAFALVVAGAVVEAQQTKKVPRIAYVLGRSGPMEFDEAFRRGLRELGYVEGQNITVEYRWGEGSEDRLSELMAEAVRLKPDLIVTAGTPAVLAAKKATATIPIIMANSPDAVRDGLVNSLARPGGNVTGLSIFLPELTGKRLELLKETVSKLSRVATIWNVANLGNAPLVRDTEVAARELGLELESIGVHAADELEKAFAIMAKRQIGALTVLSDFFMNTNRRLIAELTIKNRLPSIFPSAVYVQPGGLMSYGPDIAATYQRAAYYVDKILKGAKPADLPVEQPTKFELVINLKTAKQIGVKIPETVLFRADRVIR